MEDADGARGTSLPGSPHRDIGAPLHETSPGSLIVAANSNGNGNGFLYEHVPAASESALDAAVQDVVVSDASAGRALPTCSSFWFGACCHCPTCPIHLRAFPPCSAVALIAEMTVSHLSAASACPPGQRDVALSGSC